MFTLYICGSFEKGANFVAVGLINVADRGDAHQSNFKDVKRNGWALRISRKRQTLGTSLLGA